MNKLAKITLPAITLILFTTFSAFSFAKQDLLAPFLEALINEQVPVSIYLVNGIKLQGQIEAFDDEVIVLKNTVNQTVFKHAISTVVPARPVNH